MNKAKVWCLWLLLSTLCASAQKRKLPLINAGSVTVDIKDGDLMKKKGWTIVPAAKPDIHLTNADRVTFYTDMDSISFRVDPSKGPSDFVILLNGKDSAWTRVQYDMSRAEKLKRGQRYNPFDKRPVPSFQYQSMDDTNLVRIRQELKLDSIAGTGNEVSRILNLMHWMHQAIPHDGGSKNPAQKNALDLVRVCRTENRGLNCRMMATALNECYLSLGIKSRYITCMPRETEFDDCHVIDMVYSNDLHKWIWIDPTFDAYVMNEKGELLGIDEVRERLITKQPLILNPEANWNRKVTQTKEDYLDNYMTKNLYRMETPLRSEYDTETWKEGKEIAYVELLPLDGIVQTPQKKEQVNKQTGVRFLYYKTNNPVAFWAKP